MVGKFRLSFNPTRKAIKVYCFPGIMHKFYNVTPKKLEREVQAIIKSADVKTYFPSYRDWLTQPGVHGREVDQLVSEIRANVVGAERVIMIGFSIGGYLATLLGNLVPASHVLAYAAPTDMRSVNLGSQGRAENLDDRYFDVLPHCNGVPKMCQVTDQSQTGPKNAHNPLQTERLAGTPNLEIERRLNFDFEHDYLPNGQFARDLKKLLAED